MKDTEPMIVIEGVPTCGLLMSVYEEFRGKVTVDDEGARYPISLFEECVETGHFDFYRWVCENFRSNFNETYEDILYAKCLTSYIILLEDLEERDLRTGCYNTKVSPSATIENVLSYVRWLREIGRDCRLKPEVLCSLVVRLLDEDPPVTDGDLKNLVRSISLRDPDSKKQCLMTIGVVYLSDQKSSRLFDIMQQVGLMMTREWMMCLLEFPSEVPGHMFTRTHFDGLPNEYDPVELATREIITITDPSYVNISSQVVINRIFDRLVTLNKSHPGIIKSLCPGILYRLITASSYRRGRETDLAIRIINDDSMMPFDKNTGSVSEVTHIILVYGQKRLIAEYHKKMTTTCSDHLRANYVRDANKMIRDPLIQNSAIIIVVLQHYVQIDLKFPIESAKSGTLGALLIEIQRRNPDPLVDLEIFTIADKCLASMMTKITTDFAYLASAVQFIGPETLRIIVKEAWKLKLEEGEVLDKAKAFARENLELCVEGIIEDYLHHITEFSTSALHEGVEGMIRLSNGYLVMGSRIYEVSPGCFDIFPARPDLGVEVISEIACVTCGIKFNTDFITAYHDPRDNHGIYTCTKCRSEDSVPVPCVICLTDQDGARILGCGHGCCSSCLMRLPREEQRCPLCNARIKIKEILREDKVTPEEIARLFCEDLKKSSPEEMRIAAETAVKAAEGYSSQHQGGNASSDESSSTSDDDN